MREEAPGRSTRAGSLSIPVTKSSIVRIWGWVGLTTITGLTIGPMAKTSPTANMTAAPQNYEDAVGELDRLVGAMEAGQLPLDRLLESYKRGAELLAFCRARLDAVEQQVKILEGGQLKPWVAP
jgi:exodeoxyribonuclease VII small subunit